jgi:hypothetical protein
VQGLQILAGLVAQSTDGVDDGVDAMQMLKPRLGCRTDAEVQGGWLWRLRTTGSWSSRASAFTICRPRKPVPPQIRTRIRYSFCSFLP